MKTEQPRRDWLVKRMEETTCVRCLILLAMIRHPDLAKMGRIVGHDRNCPYRRPKTP